MLNTLRATFLCKGDRIPLIIPLLATALTYKTERVYSQERVHTVALSVLIEFMGLCLTGLWLVTFHSWTRRRINTRLTSLNNALIKTKSIPIN